MFQYIPRVGILSDMPEDFKPYYAFTAVRKFFFFLDERRTQTIPIAKLAESTVSSGYFSLYIIY